MWRDAKYLIAYIVPIATYLGIYFQGIWSFSGVFIAFLMIPTIEFFTPGTPENIPEAEEGQRSNIAFFDWLLYLNIPILYGLMIYYFITIAGGGLMGYEITGMTLSVGIVVGSIGINVAHELGHRTRKYEQLMSKYLLLSSLYMHFFIEHNRGHHKNVATREDPASARYNEIVYLFWFRSVIGGYLNAWKLEAQRLRKAGKSPFNWQNEMLRFQLIQLIYLLVVGLVFSFQMVPFAIAIAVVGFLLLETVNYIEHYGLQRNLLPSGNYEKVGPHHSWNSDHELGRIFLYELTRHSDHHYKATRKYQVLRHFEQSPQLPTGYPASILMSLVPPLWFYVMNPRVKQIAT